MKSQPGQIKFQPRFRILRGADIALGPGKVDLLEQIGETGSLTEAAANLGMSYMRAWTLIKTVEHCFAEPLVTMSRGGAKHGGAKLTPTGLRVLKLYRKLETDTALATAQARKELLRLLRH